MREMTVFVASDGSRFDTKEEAKKREKLLSDVALISKLLRPLPQNDGCSFDNGGGYIQHSAESVAKYRTELLDLIKEHVKHKWVDQSYDMAIHPSYVARLLDDYGIRPLDRAWHRLYCMDSKFREWGQPFFAMNPDKGTQRECE